MSLKIIGTGSSLPKLCVSNCDLEQLLDTSDEWITSRTGIESRHVCVEETLTDLAAHAAAAALDAAALDAAALDFIFCVTMQSDYVTPSLACMLQQRLGAACPAVDLNAACSGFLYALDIAQAYLDSGKAANILIVCAEMMSKIVDWQDRATCVLFGDGAGACVVTAGQSLEYIHILAAGNSAPLSLAGRTANHPFGELPTNPPYLHMDGQEVFKFAVTTACREVKRALAALDIGPQAVDLYLLHQANKRIIESVRTRLHLPEQYFPTNIDRCGNCSSASIPMLLDELVRGGSVQTGNRLLLTAFGAGMTAGTCVLRF